MTTAVGAAAKSNNNHYRKKMVYVHKSFNFKHVMVFQLILFLSPSCSFALDHHQSHFEISICICKFLCVKVEMNFIENLSNVFRMATTVFDMAKRMFIITIYIIIIT